MNEEDRLKLLMASVPSEGEGGPISIGGIILSLVFIIGMFVLSLMV